MNALALYIHWPFCVHKCPYCDFNSHVSAQIDHAAYADSYLTEMRFLRSLTGSRRIESLFFGGGTPSLMNPVTVEVIIDEAARLWDVSADVEITLEANPTSVENQKLRNFKAAGIGRVSLGVQALNDPDLKALGRQHSAREAIDAVEMAAHVFDRYTFDLIYARPHQTVAAWDSELQQALNYAPTHLSLYQLTIEPGTPFYTLHQRGDLVVPDEDTATDMYDVTQDIMNAKGLPAYEVSNHATPGQESRHNMVYWQYGDYAGLGPGAHGRLTIDGQKKATRTHRAPDIWLQRVKDHGHGAHPFEDIDSDQQATEALMMGLRLTSGINKDVFFSHTHRTPESILDTDRLHQAMSEDLMKIDDTHIYATAEGRKKLNTLLSWMIK